MFHNYVFKYVLDNVAGSFHVEIANVAYFYFCYLSLILPRKCEALLCYNYKNSNSQISSICLGSLSHCRWNSWSNPWRFHPVEIIHIWLISITENDTTSIQKVCYCIILVESLSMVVSSKIRSGPDNYAVHFGRIPFSFHPWYILQGNNISTHHMVNRISHSTTLSLLSDALSQYDMLKFFSDEHYNS